MEQYLRKPLELKGILSLCHDTIVIYKYRQSSNDSFSPWKFSVIIKSLWFSLADTIFSVSGKNLIFASNSHVYGIVCFPQTQ